ncbi:MAG: hypothetical protein K1X64_19970 [Myxococcaceae bacterium]|nr:hypothetical protein [Myxococcaceae bacterium]
MNLRKSPGLLALFATIFSAACQCGHWGPAAPGESCGADRGCEEELVCRQGFCVVINVENDGGTGGGSSGTGGGSTGTGGGMTGTGGGQNCGPCNTPPSACHALTGTCVNGSCEYAFITGATCDDQNPCTITDTCDNGGCSGTPKICDTPPTNVCLSGTQLKSFDKNGACQGGLCIYNSQTVACGAGGCSNGACLNDPCANVTCDVPPGDCFEAEGSCQNGVCSYPYKNGVACNDSNTCTTGDACQSGVCIGAPKVCNTPPANTCENASTAKMWGAGGGCNAGQCSYTYGFVSCVNGCSNGACNGTGWVVMTSNLTVDLRTVWGSAPNAVWAGGIGGNLVFYNGAQWQVRPLGTTAEVLQIHGTAANNVFAMTAGARVYYFDGMVWSQLPVNPTSTFTYYASAIYALGTKDCLVYADIVGGYQQLYRLHEVGGIWSWTALGPGANAFYQKADSSGSRMHADSVSSVYTPGQNYWNGTKVTQLGGVTSYPIGQVSKFGSAIYGLNYETSVATLFQYEGGPNTWKALGTGLSGVLEDFHGTSGNRIFLVGTSYPGGTTASAKGHVIFYDGVGFTDLPIPNVGRLRSVTSFASGEVFAVGHGGTIIKGP